MSVKIGVIGAGTISDQYLTNMCEFPDLQVEFIADLEVERAQARARQFGVPEAGTVDEILASDVEIIVNLTVPAAHAPVALQCLAAGKHVWLEKPLATSVAEGQQILTAAREAGLVVAGAPDTFLGAGLQTALRTVASGRLGQPVSGYVHYTTAGPQGWHPAPEFYFTHGGGPLLDNGPYYFTPLVQAFGSITKVQALGTRSQSSRTIGSGPRAGTVFPVEVDTTIVAIYETASGIPIHASFSFDGGIRRELLEFGCEQGTVIAPNPNRFEGATEVVSNRGLEAESVPAQGTTSSRGIGVVEMARALRVGEMPRASGELMLHVLEIMEATLEATRTGNPVAITSTATPPALLPPDWSPHDRWIS